MTEKTQYKLRVTEQLKERLEKLGARCGYASGNEFAAEALDQYAELLADLIQERHDQSKLLMKAQRERLLGAPSANEALARRSRK